MKLMNKFSAALLAGVALLSASPSEAQADGFHDPFGFHPPFQNFWLPPGFWPPQPQVLLPDLVISQQLARPEPTTADIHRPLSERKLKWFVVVNQFSD